MDEPSRVDPMRLEEDRALLEAYRRGERAALERIYRAYAPEVAVVLRHGFAFRSGGRACRFHGVRTDFDLEDRLQDVFARAFDERARKSYDGLTPFVAYLRTIAKNLVIDDFRKKERVLVEYSVDLPEHPESETAAGADDPLLGRADATGRPDHDRGRAEVVELVQRFKGRLEGRELRVYELRFERELEHDEIARVTGLSPSKIKTSEQRIRTSFFRFMRKHGYFKGYVQARRGWLRPLRRA